MSEGDGDRERYLEQVVQEALEAYEGVVPDEVREQMRAFLSDALATHPVGATLLDRARPRQAPDRSGDQAKDGTETELPEDERKHGGER